MGRSLRIALAALAALSLSCACARGSPEGAPSKVVLVSLDGTHPDDVRALPAFGRIAARGAFADGLEPAFPSNTFPNHVTFVTGVAPDRHGIVSNVFEDPERGLYRYEADPSWIEVEPLWSLLARAGLASASFHWVGSEGAWRSGHGPRAWRRFDASVPESEKVDQILAWLAEEDPPRLVTAWFRGADGAGHRHGPRSEEGAAALRAQDAEIGRLLDGLDARGLAASTSVLVVSDHGMARVERHVDLERELRRAGLRADAIGGGGFATVQIEARRKQDPARLAERAVEVARGLGLEAWARGACPPPLACTHPRFGALVAVAPVGTAIVDGSRAIAAPAAAVGLGLRGTHGHRPDRPEMTGLFAAVGRGVAAGLRPGRVRAVDVAPTVLALLGEPVPAWMEGRPVPLRREEAR
jgi:predicted AlkP superfamily pyrophosphatase or phosphodiesterase